MNALTPFAKPKGEELSAAQRRFNYWHSLTRGIVERALGMCKARFRWQLRGVHLRSIDSYNLWFKASCILHNICIDAGEDPDVVDSEPSDAGFEVLADTNVGKIMRNIVFQGVGLRHAPVPSAVAPNTGSGEKRRRQTSATADGTKKRH